MYTTTKSLDANVGYSYDRVGTLCDEPNGLTCSFNVATRWGRAKTLLPYSSFEGAALDVKRGELSGFLVPGAYPELSSFIMDAALVAKEVFIMKIAPLVLVGVDEAQPPVVAVVFHHPATAPLLPELPIKFQRNEFASSNSVACKLLLQETSGAAAITNMLCASFYDLRIYKVLREGIDMPFIYFAKAQDVQD